MKSITLVIAVVFSLLLSQGTVNAEEHSLFTTKSLTPEAALKAVTAALAKCRAEGYQVAVAVVDRMGNLQALLRDRYAGAHTPETAKGKAWTAASFRTNTSDMVEVTQAGMGQSGVRQVPGALMVGGGMLIDAAGSLVGAIGVSGAPSGAADDSCAAAGIAAIEEDISF
jgi:uncharacterized protein GlcG (DUF336 family)